MSIHGISAFTIVINGNLHGINQVTNESLTSAINSML